MNLIRFSIPNYGEANHKDRQSWKAPNSNDLRS